MPRKEVAPAYGTRTFDFLIACGLGYFDNTQKALIFVFTKKLHDDLYKRYIWTLEIRN